MGRSFLKDADPASEENAYPAWLEGLPKGTQVLTRDHNPPWVRRGDGKVDPNTALCGCHVGYVTVSPVEGDAAEGLKGLSGAVKKQIVCVACDGTVRGVLNSEGTIY